MKKRNRLKYGGFVLGALALCLQSALAETDAGRPNLLIIHTDEHSFRTLGCYRKTLSDEQAFVWGAGNAVATPHIDKLASDGAMCTKFYASSPVCSPSRAAFLTGQYSHETRVYRNSRAMSDEVITFAEILKQQGYATGYAGKWHLDGHGKPQWAPKRKFGFDDNRYMFNRGHWKNFKLTPDGPQIGAQKYDLGDADEKSFATDWLADRAIDFINKNKDKIFCYMVSIPDPHGPDAVRAPYDTMHDHMTFERPRTSKKDMTKAPSWARKLHRDSLETMSAYFGMVKCIDDNVGKIMACLQKNGLQDDTIVVFTSDHGDLRGEHGRENKCTPLEASAKIPFIIRYPGKIEPGKIVGEALACVDFLPTILKLMDVETSGEEAGRDASALFLDKAPADWKDVIIMREPGTNGWMAALTRRYKLVLSPTDDPWLIDMEKDPDETINFAVNPEYRDIVRTLAGELVAYHKENPDPSLDHEKLQKDLEWATGTD